MYGLTPDGKQNLRKAMMPMPQVALPQILSDGSIDAPTVKPYVPPKVVPDGGVVAPDGTQADPDDPEADADDPGDPDTAQVAANPPAAAGPPALPALPAPTLSARRD
ncbi:hypothetical protein QR77_11345 [Streptomyces sp. 150FB]|nr:hypothetical protein QR77_11345 [Streptomyces sp. 150FB]